MHSIKYISVKCFTNYHNKISFFLVTATIPVTTSKVSVVQTQSNLQSEAAVWLSVVLKKKNTYLCTFVRVFQQDMWPI